MYMVKPHHNKPCPCGYEIYNFGRPLKYFNIAIYLVIPYHAWQ